jgi:2-polyprenyl-6-methoxyphenol hydroxylase-like FAD-dependent oxidoreductase
MNNQKTNNRKHAIVIGASLGGLITARALINHFEKVTILEKDTVHDEPESRKGQPQTRHLHGLLPMGLNIMKTYFPGLLSDFESRGASVVDFAGSMQWYAYGGYRKKFHFGMNGVVASRPLIEYVVRKRLLAIPNIQLIDNCTVKQLINSENHDRVTGIVMEQKNAGQVSLDADLVIDVSGRGSRSFQWLKEMGYETPELSEVKVNVSYTTRIYRRDPQDPRGKNWIFCSPHAPYEYRAGGAFAIEGDRWIVSLGGWHNQPLPGNEEEFAAYAKSLPLPDIDSIISTCEPVSDIMQYKYPSSLRRHYEKLNRFPKGYLVLGDAACSFNPVYGQGMTSAAMQAAALDGLLHQNIAEDKLAKKFFSKAAKIIDIPWGMAVGEDFRYPETKGPKPAGINIINKYVSRVHKATLKDKVVCEAFLKVMSLLKPPASLFHPKIVWRVMMTK